MTKKKADPEEPASPASEAEPVPMDLVCPQCGNELFNVGDVALKCLKCGYRTDEPDPDAA